MRRVILQLVAGLVFSLAGFFGIMWAYTFLTGPEGGLEIIGGCKEKAFFGIFIGLPLGSLVGALTIDTVVFSIDKYRCLGFILGFISGSLLGGLITLILLDMFPTIGIYISHLVVVCISLFGYNVMYIISTIFPNHASK